MIASGSQLLQRNERIESGIALHCPCGAVFGCEEAGDCPSYCPWSHRCSFAGVERIGYPESHTLNAQCRSCGTSRSYERNGFPVAY
jgi:hypothetical protein